jgi:hypothetical protein
MEINMSSLLLFVMVTSLFVHTFWNSLLKVWSLVAAKVSGVAAIEHSIEAFVSKVIAGVLGFFKHL